MVKYSLPIGSIDGISLYISNIKVHFHYFVFYIDPEYFNALRSVLYIEKLAVS